MYKQFLFCCKVTLKRFQCTGLPYEASKLHYCHLETYRNGTQIASVVTEVLYTLQKVYVAAGLYIQYFRTRTQLLTTTMEYCQHQRDKIPLQSSSAIFAMGYAQQHLPQLLTECPVRANKVFNITGLRIDDSMVPSFVPPGTYYVELRVCNKRNQTVFQGSLEASIK
ncbi:uncharacterized protein LOC128721812 [Anopheles nili]|uniref:uncharacterized protein LOC128721812 n=1 Tax=Anopheles nili TaxID=185578 RepID=UPI00237BFF8A|nr:uncharacterized protein LOC128721812 [Anopheles nili]